MNTVYLVYTHDGVVSGVYSSEEKAKKEAAETSGHIEIWTVQ